MTGRHGGFESRGSRRAIGLACAAALVAGLPAPAHADRDVDGMTLSLSLSGGTLLLADWKAGTRDRFATILGARLERRCRLMLTFTNRARPRTYDLGQVRLLQGDDAAQIELAFVGEPDRSAILALEEPETRYRNVMDVLRTRAISCGARIAGPPPIRTGR